MALGVFICVQSVGSLAENAELPMMLTVALGDTDTAPSPECQAGRQEVRGPSQLGFLAVPASVESLCLFPCTRMAHGPGAGPFAKSPCWVTGVMLTSSYI